MEFHCLNGEKIEEKGEWSRMDEKDNGRKIKMVK